MAALGRTERGRGAAGGAEVTPKEARLELAAAGRALAEADQARAAALQRIAAAMKAGVGELNVKEMAELAGVSRVTAYRLLERANG